MQDTHAGRSDTAPFPDALFLPETLKAGPRQIDRINSVLKIAEPILSIDRSQGERGYIRRQPGGRLFITKNPGDTLLHPVGHPLEGGDRYHWSARPDGIELGYLKENTAHGTA